MRYLILFAASLALCSCQTGAIKNGDWTSSYILRDVNQKSLVGPAGKISNVNLSRSFVEFTFSNNTNSTSKILWDESTIIMPDGKVARLSPVGSKFIDSGRSFPPDVVPAGASLDTGVSRAGEAHFSSIGMISRWDAGEIVPCNSDEGGVFNSCDRFALSGRPLAVLITIEHDGKKTEYKINGTLDKNPEYVAAHQASKKASSVNGAKPEGNPFTSSTGF